MPQQTEFTTFVTLVDVVEPTVQNPQDLASIWGEIRNEFEVAGAEIRDSFAVLGAVDFIVVFEAPDQETAFQASIILERHGLDTHTMEVTPTERFATLVKDL